MIPIALKVVAGFAAGMALLLLLRTSEWIGAVFDMWRARGMDHVRADLMHPISFPRWTVRAGTLLQSVCALCFGTLFYQGIVEAPQTSGGLLLEAIGLLSSSILVAWRWHHFAQKKRMSWIAMGTIFVVSLLFVLGGLFAWR